MERLLYIQLRDGSRSAAVQDEVARGKTNSAIARELGLVSSAIVKSPFSAIECPHGNDSESPHLELT